MTNSRMLLARPLRSPAQHSPASARGGLGLLRWLWQRLRYELLLRRDIHDLERLDDARLADLGISRGAIDGAVRGLFDPHR